MEDYENILCEYVYDLEKGTDNIKELEEKYGLEKVNSAFTYDQLCSTVSASWECRDCFIQWFWNP